MTVGFWLKMSTATRLPVHLGSHLAHVGISAEAALSAISDAERVQGAVELQPSWEALVERWPGLAMGWFGLGNARYASDDRAGAADAFRFATLHDPELAAAWLNLGLTLHSLGQQQEARTALEQAAALPGKWQETAKQALERYQASASS